MIVLFSPSEGKFFLDYKTKTKCCLDFQSFTFLGSNKELREQIIRQYMDFLKTAQESEILELFGYKEIDLDVLKLSQNLLDSPVIEAIRLYSGVAYEYLDFENQMKDIQNLLLERVVIFSNLFGPLKGGDFIPYYRLQQGKFIGNLKEYYAQFAEELDNWCEKEDILDLRADFYKKLYQPKGKIYCPVFYKNGKKLSHYAKAYRGYFLHLVARKFLVTSAKGWDLLSFEIPGVRQKGVNEKEGVILIDYEIEQE
ncbi:hypothetical protein CCZ01_06875 [Helicobacter monodelphidis]|uniref:peroxide stress protein YaaA n=1 Tax=Helicobacter sp. 15-1451 TaxID=2004995 RepID=UPI000DCAFE10|nr:peroxide stress protein YaaA [Helicobacter sp. 15-1451]RAX57181.1 hypothetical protein CCZ01_06875 [Helicobacter sp. 15-1451]